MKTVLRKMMRKTIWLINCIFPKKKNRIMLRSAFRYPDNIQAVLEALLARSNDYTVFCVGNGFEAYNDKRIIKYTLNSIKAVFSYFSCKYVIYDSAIFLESPPVNKQIAINLWHGLSLKKIGYYENENTKKYRTATFGVTYSPLFAEKMANAFAIPPTCILCTGEPRNDYLFNPAPDSMLKDIGIPIKPDCKYVIWMPTYRQSKFHDDNDGALYEYGFPLLNSENISSLHDFCVNNNIVLILKWHGSQILPSMQKHEWENFCFLTSEKITECRIPFYRVVARCDALITDYSSIFVNYMVLDRPICFAYDDMDEYIKNRGFMFEDVTSIMPGMHVHSMEGLYSFLAGIENDEYMELRSRMRTTLNSYNDNRNCERLLDFLRI